MEDKTGNKSAMQQAQDLLEQKEKLQEQINTIDNQMQENALPWSKAEKLNITEKDLNNLYNTTPTAMNSTQFNPYMTRTMPATYQYGGVTGEIFGGEVNKAGFEAMTMLMDGPFTIIQKYLAILAAQSERFEYNNWPDNFKFTYHDFERKLVESGRAGVVKVGENIMLSDFEPTKIDYLNRPVQIKPLFNGVKPENTPNWSYKRFEEDEFVIAYNNMHQMSTFPMIIRWLVLWEQAHYQIEKQNRLLNPKVFVNGNLKLRKANLEEPLNKVMNSEDTFKQIFLPSDVAGRDQMINGQKFQDSLDKLFATIQFDSRVADYQAIISIAEDRINEALGLSINPLEDKAERVNTLEINSAQDLTRLTAKHMFKMRKEAIDQINKKFNVNISVEQDETAYEDSIENTNTGNIERNVNGGEDNAK